MAGPIEILLIEDDPVDRELFVHAAEKVGVHVHVHAITDAVAGREYLAGSGAYRDRGAFPFPDLVVLGLLQDSSGLEFLPWCRKHPLGKRLPLLVLTRAAAEDSRVDQTLEYGATDVFFKPGDLSGLKQIVEEMVGTLDTREHSPTE